MRPRIVDPLGARAKVRTVSAEGEERAVVPTIDTYVRRRVRAAKRKVTVRIKNRM